MNHSPLLRFSVCIIMPGMLLLAACGNIIAPPAPPSPTPDYSISQRPTVVQQENTAEEEPARPTSTRTSETEQAAPTATMPRPDTPDNIDTVLLDSAGTPLLRVLGYEAQPQEGALQLDLYFEVLAPLEDDYRIWMHGTPASTALLPPTRREAGFLNFDHDPQFPTSQWSPDSLQVDTYTLEAPPGDYNLSFGLWLPDQNERLRPADPDNNNGISLGRHTIPGARPALPDNIDTVLLDSAGTPLLRVLGYEAQPQEGALQLDLYFEVLAPLEHDYRIWMHGTPLSTALLPPARREAGFLNFDHDPQPPTSQWSPDSFQVDTYTLEASPGDYNLSFGLWLPDQNERLRPADPDNNNGISLGRHTIPGPPPSEDTEP